MRTTILLFALVSCLGTAAQDTLMAVYGTAVDVLTRQPLKDLSVIAYEVTDTSVQASATIEPDGGFMLGIFDQRDKMVVFEAPGYVPRRILIEMDGPTEEQWKEGYGLSLEIALYEEIPGLDLTMDDVPVGRSLYDPETDLFEWDRAYSRSINDRNKDLLKIYKQKISR